MLLIIVTIIVMSLLIPFSTRTGFFDPFLDNSVASLIAGAVKLNIYIIQVLPPISLYALIKRHALKIGSQVVILLYLLSSTSDTVFPSYTIQCRTVVMSTPNGRAYLLTSSPSLSCSTLRREREREEIIILFYFSNFFYMPC